MSENAMAMSEDLYLYNYRKLCHIIGVSVYSSKTNKEMLMPDTGVGRPFPLALVSRWPTIMASRFVT